MLHDSAAYKFTIDINSEIDNKLPFIGGSVG